MEDEVLDAFLEALNNSPEFPEALIEPLKRLRNEGRLTNAHDLFEAFTKESGDGSEDPPRKT